MKYTVVLMLPDYAAENFGQDSMILHPESTNALQAIRKAQESAAEVHHAKPEDFYPVAAFAGWLDDLSTT